MLHARKDYNERVQDSSGIIPDNEPVFLLRGKDVFAPILLDLYAAMVEYAAVSDKVIVRDVRTHAKAMRRWQKDCVQEFPDMDEKDSVY